ncbi:MAG: type II secretion system F family protein [Candidatus Aminicenantia bacterium]
MPIYNCRVSNERGEISNLVLFARSKNEAKNLIEAKGMLVLKIKFDIFSIFKNIRILFSKKVRDNDFLLFNHEFVALIKSGTPILRAIEILTERVKDPLLREILLNVKEEIKKGKSPSEAFSPWQKYLSSIYIASILAGERTGNLEGTVRRFIYYQKTIIALKTRIRYALAYPSLLFIFAFFVLFVLLSFIIPRFASFYADFESQLPSITLLLINFSKFISRNLKVFIAGLLIVIFIFEWLKRREKGVLILDKMVLRLPFISDFIKKGAISIFSRTTGLLLEGGIPLISAIETAVKAIPNNFLSNKFNSVINDVRGGESLSASLEKLGIFPEISIEMIRVGESTASLPEMLSEVANFWDERMEERLSALVSLIEPVVILFMGVLIAGILLSVYLPLFRIITLVR